MPRSRRQTPPIIRFEDVKPAIQKRISDEFETPEITGIVRDEAQSATATTANKIIRDEVQSRVSNAITLQQAALDRTLNTAATNAVTAVQGDIQTKADKAVQQIVVNRFDPELKRLRAYPDATFLFESARVGNATSFDRVVALASDPSVPSDLRTAANATVSAIRVERERTLYGVDCKNMPHSIQLLREALNSSSHEEQQNAVYCSGHLQEMTAAGIPQADVRELAEPLFLLELITDGYTAAKRRRNQACASRGFMAGRCSATAWWRASISRALAERMRCLSLAQAFSMGLRSGE